MCSKSSYLPSLEGMPCKMWLAVCSMAALTSEGLFYWLSALPQWLDRPSPADACPCLTSNLHLSFPPPLVWLLALRPPHRPRRSGGTCGLYGIWLAGCMQERITEAKQIQHCYYNRWGKRGIQYLDRCHLLIPPVWKLDIVQNECLSNDVGDKGHIYEARQSSVFAEQAQYNCRP